MAIPALGGTTSYVAPEPAPAPTLTQWFIGGSFGQFDVDSNTGNLVSQSSLNDFAELLGYDDYQELILSEDFNDLDLPSSIDFDDYDGVDDSFSDLAAALAAAAPAGGYGLQTQVDDVELNMYTLHFGRDLGSFSGFDLAAYLEVGWLTGDMDLGINYISPVGVVTNVFSDSLDVDVVPVTINIKAEHALFGPVGAYASGGIGYAWTMVQSDSGGIDDNDGGFYAQASAGLVWNATESFDIYGGARWVHFESLDFGDSGFELDDQIGWEIGARYKF